MKTKHSPYLAEIETKQAASKALFHDTMELLKSAEKCSAGYQEGDSAWNALKKAAEAFLSDANATHSTTQYPS